MITHPICWKGRTLKTAKRLSDLCWFSVIDTVFAMGESILGGINLVIYLQEPLSERLDKERTNIKTIS